MVEYLVDRMVFEEDHVVGEGHSPVQRVGRYCLQSRTTLVRMMQQTLVILGDKVFLKVATIGEITLLCGPNALWKPQTLIKTIDVAADIANPDREMKRIVGLGIPLTLGAVSDSVFQAIIVAVISNSIGTDSMAAFILVSLFLGLSDDLVGAIADAESALCSHTLSMGNMNLVGQYVQLATGFHLIVFAAIMVLWISYMDSIVEWLVASPDIAAIALSYTRISVFQHLLQTLSRTFTVLFHLVGSENFESQVDFCEGLLTVIMVACVLPLYGDATLDSVGWMQLTTAMGAFVVKLMHAATRGWTSLFWRGLLGDGAFRVSLRPCHLIFVCFFQTSHSAPCFHYRIRTPSNSLLLHRCLCSWEHSSNMAR